MRFDYENASLHFLRTDGPKGFAWKYVLTYTLLNVAIFVITMIALGGSYAGLAGSGPADDAAEILAETPFAIIYIVTMVLTLLLYAIFEACYLRRYLHGAGFRLRLGADECRIFVVLLIWIAIVLLMLGAFMGLFAVSIGTMEGSMIDDEKHLNFGGLIAGFLAYVVFFGGLVFLGIRFGPAAAMTVRDGRIRFLDAWNATRGRWWVLFGAYAAWTSVAMIVYILVLSVVMTMFVPILLLAPTVEETSGLLPRVGVGMAYTALLAAGVYFYYIWAGPAALAAKTDPRYVNAPDVIEAEAGVTK